MIKVNVLSDEKSWSKKLKKSKLVAHQVSQRGGVLSCEDLGERVHIGGKAIEYMKGEINI